MSNLDSHNKDILNLWQRFLDGTTTAEEKVQVLKLIDSGMYDELIGNNFLEDIVEEEHRQRPSKERTETDNIYALLTAKVRQSRPRFFLKWAAAVAILAISSVTLWVIKERNLDAKVIASQEELTTISYKGKEFIHLPDGSTVLLNANSELSYDVSFGANSREVVLSGEAYFDIQHNPGIPFIVHAGTVTTKVLGTAFNVNAHPGNGKITVTVTRGLVEVGNGDNVFGLVKADQKIIVNTATYDVEKVEVNASSEMTWKEGTLVMDDVTFEQAAVMISDFYNVKVTIGNDNLKKCRISASFLHNEDLKQVVELICGIRQAKYAIENDSVIINDGIACGNE